MVTQCDCPEELSLLPRDTADLLRALPIADVYTAARTISSAHARSGTIYLAGNGGSASTAEHLSNDLVRSFDVLKSPGRVNCLSSNMSVLLAIANDFGYDHVFSRQLYWSLSSKDVLILISVSGRSPNCVHAARVARENGAAVIVLTGRGSEELRELAAVSIIVPHDDYMLVENVHVVICHMLALSIRSLIT